MATTRDGAGGACSAPRPLAPSTKEVPVTERDPSTPKLRNLDAETRRRIRDLIGYSRETLESAGDGDWFDARMCELEDLRTEVIRRREGRPEFSDPESFICDAGPQGGDDFKMGRSTIGAFVSVSDQTLDQYGHTLEFQRFIAGTLSRNMVKGICPVKRALSIVQRWVDDAKARKDIVEKLKHRRLP